MLLRERLEVLRPICKVRRNLEQFQGCASCLTGGRLVCAGLVGKQPIYDVLRCYKKVKSGVSVVRRSAHAFKVVAELRHQISGLLERSETLEAGHVA